MFFYKLYAYENCTYLMHDCLFTEQEFEKMCEETHDICGTYEDCIDREEICEYLVKNNGFKEVIAEQEFGCNI